MRPKNGRITTNAAGPDMKRRTKTLLTTLIVLTITAIFIVGFVLAWDVFDFKGKLDKLFDTNFYATEEPLYLSDVKINLTSSGTSALPAAEKELIENYFTCYYASLGGFYHENMKRFYDFRCSDEFIDELTLDFEINAAKNAPADYSFKECDVHIYIVSRRTTNEGTVELTVQCSAEMQYGFSDVKTKNDSETHTFIISTEDERLIKAHTSDRVSRKYAETVLTEVVAADGYTLSDLSYTYFYPYAETALSFIKTYNSSFRGRLAELLSAQFSPTFACEYEYNRAAACEYARESEGHSPKFGSYDENDTNFCSQCLFAAGIPMDAQGDRLTQWKWYGYDINNAREHSGCTESWYDRDSFWTYATENTGFGLVACEVSDCALPGDIIRLTYLTAEKKNKKTEAVLHCMITDTVLDKSGNPVDYIVCTDKIKNMPLSLLWNGDFSILSVIGYNTANI